MEATAVFLLLFSLLIHATTLSPPDGNSIDLEVAAKGFQIYSCVDSMNTGNLSWILQRAEARLYDTGFKTLLGFHYFLPKPDAGNGRATWALLQNPGSSSNFPSSTVTGKVIMNQPSQVPGNINDLLIQATSHSGHTRLSRTSYIQRVENRGGIAPSSDFCKVKGLTQAVPYEAHYIFWIQQTPDASDHGFQPLLLFGEGFQHYEYNGSDWQLFNATALLTSSPGQEVIGQHYFLKTKDSLGGQPTWSTFSYRSSVTAKAVKTTRPATSDSISWVDLDVTENSGDKRLLGDVSLVQRRSTRGGLPPKLSPSSKRPQIGEVFLSPYTAIYWFHVSSSEVIFVSSQQKNQLDLLIE